MLNKLNGFFPWYAFCKAPVLPLVFRNVDISGRAIKIQYSLIGNERAVEPMKLLLQLYHRNNKASLEGFRNG